LPAKKQARFYRLANLPDLFGGFSLAREYGRIGQPGRLQLDPFPEIDTARKSLCPHRQQEAAPGIYPEARPNSPIDWETASTIVARSVAARTRLEIDAIVSVRLTSTGTEGDASNCGPDDWTGGKRGRLRRLRLLRHGQGF